MLAGHTFKVWWTFSACLTGQPVSIALFGSSWSTGSGVENINNSWAARLFAWVNGTFPNSRHTFTNLAQRGTTSGFAAPCLANLAPADVDLVLLEFTINDGYQNHHENEYQFQKLKWWEDHFESPARCYLRGLSMCCLF